MGATAAANARGVAQRRSWLRRFAQQYTSLLRKNLLVALRNWRSTAVRTLLAPLLFLSLTWVVNEALVSGNTHYNAGRNIPDPHFTAVGAVPDCAASLFLRDGCLDFVYAPADDRTVTAVVRAIRLNNPGRPIPRARVLGFPSVEAANAYELANPQIVAGGLFFQCDPLGNLAFVVQSNSTTKSFHGSYEDPTLHIQVPLQVAAEREIARRYFQQEGRDFNVADWMVSLASFAHPAVDNFSVVGIVLAPFIFAANMFGFVLAITAVASEREIKLRQALDTAGMLRSAHWASWATFEVVMGLESALLLCALGAAWQFDMFLKNSLGVLFFLFFLFQLAMSGLAFLVSTAVSKASTGTNLGFAIFLVGWIMQAVVIFGYPYTPAYYHNIPLGTALFALCPWTLLSKAILDLGHASAEGQAGIGWADRSRYCQDLSSAPMLRQPLPGQHRDSACVLPIGSCLLILLGEAIGFLLLAVYCDNVLPDENGMRQPLWYPLQMSYWGAGRTEPQQRSRRQRRAWLRPASSAGLPDPDGLDPDVAAEKQELQALVDQHDETPLAGSSDETEAFMGSAGNAVEVYGLQKLFHRPSRWSWNPRRWTLAWPAFLRPDKCRVRKCTTDFWALKGSYFAIPKGQLFCLLGPNGAGKTTTINCLTGTMLPSGGDALVHRVPLSAPGSVDRIRERMGVCPQADILWAELTGREHLHLYGAIKGMDSARLKQQAESLLAQVGLTAAATTRTGRYSGGMRRRLSVAIALLGDPDIVYLDEPTTGMDPISRRATWDIIEAAKPDRAIVLTTHSMEEADILGDRIAIMAKGQLRAIGTALHLKQRFGAGYQVAVSTMSRSRRQELTAAAAAARPPNLSQMSFTHVMRSNAVKDFFSDEMGLEPSDESRAYVQFLVPHTRQAEMAEVLERLEARSAELGVSDIQLSLSSLEEVFLTIARKAEQESAYTQERNESAMASESATLEGLTGQATAEDPETGSVCSEDDDKLSTWTKLTQCAAEIRRTLPESALQLPTVVGPLRRALQAPQEWPTALAALLGSQLTPMEASGASDPVAADTRPAGVTEAPSEPGGPASPPLTLSSCASVASFRKDSFTTASGPCTPPGTTPLFISPNGSWRGENGSLIGILRTTRLLVQPTLTQASEQLDGAARMADGDNISIVLSAQSSHGRSASPAWRPPRTVRFADESRSERHGAALGGAASETSTSSGDRQSTDWDPRSLLKLDLADGGLTRGPPPAARQQRMGRPAALGASVSWDGAGSRSPRRLTDDSGTSSPRDAGEALPDGAMASLRSRYGRSNSVGHGRCEIQPIDGDDDRSDGTAARSSTVTQSSNRGAPSAGNEQLSCPAAPSDMQHSRRVSAPGSVTSAPIHAPAAGQPRGTRTISRVGLRATADPRWRTDPRRMAAVQELLRGRNRRAQTVQGLPAAPADLARAGAACSDSSRPSSSGESSQQPSDMDAVGTPDQSVEPSPASTRRGSRHLGAAAVNDVMKPEGASAITEPRALEAQAEPDVAKAAFLAALARIEKSSPQTLGGRTCNTE